MASFTQAQMPRIETTKDPSGTRYSVVLDGGNRAVRDLTEQQAERVEEMLRFTGSHCVRSTRRAIRGALGLRDWGGTVTCEDC